MYNIMMMSTSRVTLPWHFLVFLVVSLSCGGDTNAFAPTLYRLSHPHQQHPAGSGGGSCYSTHHVCAAKSICTFDETDFAGRSQDDDWPYEDKDLNRLDNSDDVAFYVQPRFVTHIDDTAIAMLTDYYRQEFQDYIVNNKNNNKKESSSSLDVLDLCSSWISHLPEEGVTYGKVVGLGMNQDELAANQQLTDVVVQDLNENPFLSQFDDDSFDVICNAVSVDYLTKPLQVFQEMHRILRPGGIALVSFSNRCFPTKAVAMWLQADDIGRLTIVASYFHYAATWSSLEALDVKEMQEPPSRPSPMEVWNNPSVGLAWMNSASAVAKNNQGDPMFVVKAVK